jgi:hypothetical protein
MSNLAPKRSVRPSALSLFLFGIVAVMMLMVLRMDLKRATHNLNFTV